MSASGWFYYKNNFQVVLPSQYIYCRFVFLWSKEEWLRLFGNADRRDGQNVTSDAPSLPFCFILTSKSFFFYSCFLCQLWNVYNF